MNNFFTRAIARASGTSRITPLAAARFAPAPVFAEVHDDESGDAAGLDATSRLAVRPASAADATGPFIDNRRPPGMDSSERGPLSSGRGVTTRDDGDVAGDVPPAPPTTAVDSRIRQREMEGQLPAATTAQSLRDQGSSAIDATPQTRAPERQARAEAIDSFLLMPVQIRAVAAAHSVDAHQSLGSRRLAAASEPWEAAADRRRDSRDLSRDEVHITIGRLEVTAMHAPAPPRRPATAPADPAMSLDQYLARRRGSR
jgi:hypothetical protein